MAEHDGLTFASVLVKDLDAVFGLHDAHGVPTFATDVVAREIEIKVGRLRAGRIGPARGLAMT
jgi:hypothetical protein